MNLEKIKQRLETYQNIAAEKAASSNNWKPPAGKSQVRLVPYTHDKDAGFVELILHYNVSKVKPVLSPASYGEPDPIIEFANKLQRTGNKEDYLLAKKLLPTERVFTTIIVRGKESEGVKVWGFSPTLHKEMLEMCQDPDIGIISHPTTGRDLQVQLVTPAEAGNKFGKTKISFRPSQSPLTDNAEELKKLLTNQPNIKESFKRLTYDELNAMLKEYLNPDNTKQDEQTSSKNSKKSSETSIGKRAKESAGLDSPDAVSAAFEEIFKEN